MLTSVICIYSLFSSYGQPEGGTDRRSNCSR